MLCVPMFHYSDMFIFVQDYIAWTDTSGIRFTEKSKPVTISDTASDQVSALTTGNNMRSLISYSSYAQPQSSGIISEGS